MSIIKACTSLTFPTSKLAYSFVVHQYPGFNCPLLKPKNMFLGFNPTIANTSHTKTTLIDYEKDDMKCLPEIRMGCI